MDRFRYVSAPVVRSISTHYLATRGGRRVILTGVDFRHVRRVVFGSVAGRAISSISPTRLSVIAPRHSPGGGQVRVVTAYGRSTKETGRRPVAGEHFVPDAVVFLSRPSISASPLPTATAGLDYQVTLTAAARRTGRWTLSSPPPGLHLSRSVLLGRPTTAGSFAFPVRFTDLAGQTTRRKLTLDVGRNHWRPSTFPLPSDAGSSPEVSVAGLQCVSSTFCAATGNYMARGTGTFESFLAVRSAGSWDVVREALTGTDVGVLASNGHQANNGQTRSISCAAPGSCVAIARSQPAGEIERATTATLNDGTWTVQVAPQPDGSVWSDFRSVSCWAADGCVAVGYSNEGAVIDELGSDGWSAAPETAQLGHGLDLLDVACDAAGVCTAVGTGDSGAVVISNRTGSWQAEHLTAPSDAGPDSYLGSISCPDQDTCTAVGAYEGASERTLVESNRTGSWQPQAGPESLALMDGVSCPTATNCLGWGRSVDHYDGELGLETDGSWDVPAPSLSTYSHPVTVDCPSTSFCAAGGDWVDAQESYRTGMLGTVQDGVFTDQSATLPANASAPPGANAHSAIDAVSCVDGQTCVALGGYFSGRKYLPLVEDYAP